MIIYRETVSSFIRDCRDNVIASRVLSEMRNKGLGYATSDSLARSFFNSLPEMGKVLDSPLFLPTLDVAVEYKLNTSQKRVDFIVYGKDEFGKDNAVIIELKQWSEVRPSNLQDHVYTNGGDGQDDYWHPSYQAYNYATSLRNFNEFVRDNDIGLPSCAYLHNMSQMYDHLLESLESFPLVKFAPAFLKGDIEKLRDFIHRYVKVPSERLLYDIDMGRISPSTELANSLNDALKGKPFFSYDDAQARSVAMIVASVKEAVEQNKRRTIVIKGGPGTGKSVVAINALGQLLNAYVKGRRINAAYFTQNAAPRQLFKEELTDHDYHKYEIAALLKSPLSMKESRDSDYDCALVDEAHRLIEWKGGTGMKSGTNLLDKVIHGSRVNVFFIDEDQAVTIHDYATRDTIKFFANKYGSEIIEGHGLELTSQYRCMGGENYISFVRGLLGYPDSVPHAFKDPNYDFRLYERASDMKAALKEMDDRYGKSRIVAGYTYDWVSRKTHDEEIFDIVLDDGTFKMKWNMDRNDYSYLNDKDSFEQVGCIHTIQGLDMQYCGVIIGKDMRYEDGHIVYDKRQNAKTDRSSEIKRADDALAEKLIRNTYNVLLTRGMRGTFVYCEDKPLLEHFRKMLSK